MTRSVYVRRRPRVTDAWLDRLLPASCVSCGSRLDDAGRGLELCRRCRGRLVAWPTTVCPGCGEPGPRDTGALCAELCARCRARPLPWSRLICGWRYQEPMDAVVKALKFGRQDYLASYWGDALAYRVVGAALPSFDAVVPIPLHWRRRMSRGYNQAALLAEPLARACDAPLRSLLARPRATTQRSLLPAAARQPLGEAFRARQRSPTTVALVDDVMTSGATLASAARALRHAGAREVVAVTLARTPDTPLAADVVYDCK